MATISPDVTYSLECSKAEGVVCLWSQMIQRPQPEQSGCWVTVLPMAAWPGPACLLGPQPAASGPPSSCSPGLLPPPARGAWASGPCCATFPPALLQAPHLPFLSSEDPFRLPLLLLPYVHVWWLSPADSRFEDCGVTLFPAILKTMLTYFLGGNQEGRVGGEGLVFGDCSFEEVCAL